MEIEIITKADLEIFKKELINQIKELFQRKTEAPDDRKWVKSKDVQRILQISPGTLQTLRNRKLIPFTRLGGVIYYKQEDLKKVMDKKGEDEFEFLKKRRI